MFPTNPEDQWGLLITDELNKALFNYEKAYGAGELAKLIVAWFKRHGFPKELKRHL